MFRWLTDVQEQFMLNESKQRPTISRSAFNASVVEKQTGIEDVSVLLPFFQESSKSSAMITNGINVIKTAVDKVYKVQTPVIVFDQSLYVLVKKVQRNWKDIYRETQSVVMMDLLHTKMAALKTLGDWLENSGWCSALVEAEIAS